MRVVFRLFYALLLLGVFTVGAWLAFQKSIVGRSVTVPDLTGKTVLEAIGAAQLKVPDLEGLPPRAAALKLSQQSLELGAVSWYRDGVQKVGIVSQDPEPEAVAARSSNVEVLTNRGAPE